MSKMGNNFVIYGIDIEPTHREFRTPEEILEIALELDSRRSNKRPDNSRLYSDK